MKQTTRTIKKAILFHHFTYAVNVLLEVLHTTFNV